MAVEVVLGEVQEHGALGREGVGVLELEARRLAHHGRAARSSPDQRGHRRADVPGHHRRRARGAVDAPEQLDGGRLAVGPVTATNGSRSSRQASSSSPTTATPARAAASRTGACCGTPGLLTTVAARASGAARRCAGARRPPRAPPPRRLARVAPQRLAALAQRERGRHPGAGQPHDEIGAGRKGRPRLTS